MRSMILLLLVAWTTAVEAQTALLVNVTDASTGVAVKGATVSLTRNGGTLVRVETDSTGGATFSGLTAGLHSVSAQAIGFEAATPLQVDIEAGIFTELNVSLKAAPIGLKPVEATAKAEAPAVPDLKLNGFYERMKFNNGIFVDQAEIEKRDQRLISDLIRSKPGVNLRPGNTGEMFMWFRGNEMPSFTDGGVKLCGPSIFLDGMKVHQGGDEPSPVDRFVKTIDLAGIEIYRRPSSIPEQYGGATSGCGVVLLWTRVRS